MLFPDLSLAARLYRTARQNISAGIPWDLSPVAESPGRPGQPENLRQKYNRRTDY